MNILFTGLKMLLYFVIMFAPPIVYSVFELPASFWLSGAWIISSFATLPTWTDGPWNE